MIRLCAFSDEAAPSLTGQIAAMKRNGIGLTELRSVDGVNVKDLSERTAEEIRRELDEGGIAVWAIGSPLGKVDISLPFAEYCPTVEHVMRLGRILGTKRIRIFSFFSAYDAEQIVVENLKRMVEIADRYGMILCHENEKDIFGDRPDRILRLHEQVKGMRLVYDPANFLQVNERAEDTPPLLHGLCDYFHIKDVISADGTIVPAGEGDGRIGELIDGIAPDRDTVLTLEPHLRVFAGYGAIDGSEMKNRYAYPSNDAAFDAAATALRELLRAHGWKETKGVYEYHGSRT